MNRFPLAFALLGALVLFPTTLTAAPCTDNFCRVLILPDLAQVPLPLDGWLVRSGTPSGNISISQPPRYGTFDLATQTYAPTPTFWSLGLDQMEFDLGGGVKRVVLLVSATPILANHAQEDFDGGAVGTWTTEGAVSFSGTPGSNSLLLQVAPGQTNTQIPFTGQGSSGQGGNFLLKPGAPGGGLGNLEGGEVVVQSVGGLYEIQLKTEGQLQFVRARATHPGFFCSGATSCVTPYHPIPSGAWTRISALIGPTTIDGPDSAYTLRMNLEVPGQQLAHYEIGKLNAVELDQVWVASFGLAGANASSYSVEIDNAETYSLQRSLEDLTLIGRAERFEASGPGYEAVWTTDGSLSLASLGATQWLEAGVVNLAPSGCNRLIDVLPSYRSHLRLNFHLDLTSLNLTDNESVVILASAGISTAGTPRTVELVMRKAGGAYSLRARAFKNTVGTVATTAFLPLSEAAPGVGAPPNVVGLEWSAGAGNGSLRLKVNHQFSEVNDIDTGAHNVGTVSLGSCMVTLGANPSPPPVRAVHIDNYYSVY